MKKCILLCVLGLLAGNANAAKLHHCNENAIAQAKSLLQFHFGKDDRIAIEQKAAALKPIKNPANAKQMYDVLEVWGNIYKGRYRMRFTYMQSKDECVLIGQEVMEHAKP